MALQKSVTTEHGYTAEYWRVSPGCTVDFSERSAYAPVLLYVSQDARQEGKHRVDPPQEVPYEVRQVSIAGTEFEDALATGDVRSALYAKLKTTAFFADAVDC